MAARRDRLFEPSGVRVRQQARLPEEQLLKILAVIDVAHPPQNGQGATVMGCVSWVPQAARS